MKKFLYTTALFLAPFLFLVASTFFYSKDKGDLLRVGFLKADKPYREIFQSEFNRPVYYDTLSRVNTQKKSSYTVLIFGDSFSAQGCFSYQNYLAQSDSISVLYCDINKYGNSIETLYGALNDKLFDSIDVRYVVLESVERDFAKRGYELNKQTKLSTLPKPVTHSGKINYNTSFPPPELVKFPLFSLLYHFSDNAFLSEVYQVKINRPLFSGSRESTLLFSNLDLKNIDRYNNLKAVTNLNKVLNIVSKKLQEKSIKLIVLPSPDKYDLYYEYITNKANYTKPLFFDLMKQMDKNYGYIDSKKILSQVLKTKKDIYFFDDTHWSPWGSQLIAKELSNIIQQKK